MISNEKERDLAITVLRLPEQLDLAIDKLDVNRVCELVYDIATKMSSYYAAVKVIGSPEEASRILLIDSIRKTMKVCFDLLGMKTISKM